MKTSSLLSLTLFNLVLCLAQPAPLGTAFTYQGRLIDNGQLANGAYALRFALHDAEANGNQVGLTITNEDVIVANGLFTTQLDFGASVFDGTNLWLEISVRAGASTNRFVPLTPRQALTPAPYALYALYAPSAGTARTASTATTATSAAYAGVASNVPPGIGITNAALVNPQDASFITLFSTNVSAGVAASATVVAGNSSISQGSSLIRVGTVLSPLAVDTNILLESTIIYDRDPLLLTNAPNVFKAWFSVGTLTNVNLGVSYAESTDGLHWARLNALVAPGYYRSFVLKDGTSYKMWAVPQPGDAQIDYLTSTTGTNFTLNTAAVINHASGSAWDADYVVNPCVLKESATKWTMLYEGRKVGQVWALGLATSTDGVSWTRSSVNPVLSQSGSTGGPYLFKIESTYYLLAHVSPLAGGYLPTEIHAYNSTDLTNWTVLNGGIPIMARAQPDEAPSNNNGQTADATVVQVNSTTWLFYTATPDQTNFHVNAAFANMPLSNWVKSWNGEATRFNGSVSMAGALNVVGGFTGSTVSGSSATFTSANFGSTITGNAQFQGTDLTSYFYWGINQDLYLRPGKTTGTIFIQDTPNAINTILNQNGGDVGIGTSSPQGNKLKVGGTMAITSTMTSYNGDTTAANGLPALVGSASLTAQTASLGATTLFTAPATGLYEVSGLALCTSAGSAGTLRVTISWTDEVGGTSTSPVDALSLSSSGRAAINPLTMSVVGGGAIQYLTTVSGAVGSPQYALKLVVKRLL